VWKDHSETIVIRSVSKNSTRTKNECLIYLLYEKRIHGWHIFLTQIRWKCSDCGIENFSVALAIRARNFPPSAWVINPLMPELYTSVQFSPTKFITKDFASWIVKFVNNQQIQQLFIQFINYVRYVLHVSALLCHLQEAFLVYPERCSIEEQSIEYCGWACCVRSPRITPINTTRPSQIFYRLLLNWASLRKHEECSLKKVT
jgi:hypothetical protein